MATQKTEESKYIQQHLANERTFLAWIRTAIAIIGIGFLATSLHFNTVDESNKIADMISIIISIVSLVLGVSTIIGATINYYRIRRNINSQTFTSSSVIIKYMTFIAIFIILLILGYFIFV